jgi:hypothetical protein
MHRAPKAQSYLSAGYKRKRGTITKVWHINENKDVDSVSVHQVGESNPMHARFQS